MVWQQDWAVPRRARECAASGRAFQAGDRVVSELFERDETFERRDRLESAEVDPGEGAPFSRWVSIWPPEPTRAPGVDLELARTFLRDLLREDEPARRPLAHVLALLLIRKKRLKVRGRGRTDDGREMLRISPLDDPEEILDIPVPPMTPDVVATVSAQIAHLFGFGPGPVLEGEEPAADADADGAPADPDPDPA